MESEVNQAPAKKAMAPNILVSLILGIVLSGISLIIILICDGNALAVVDMIEDEL